MHPHDPDQTVSIAQLQAAVPPDALEDHLQETTLGSLPTVFRFLAVTFVIFAVFNAVDFEPPVRGPMVAFDLILVALYAGIAAALNRLPPRAAAPLAAFAGSSAASNTLAALYLLGDPFYTTYLHIILIATGYLVLHRGWLALAVGLVSLGWYFAAADATTPKELLHHGAALAVGAGVAFMLNALRSRSLARMLGLQLRDRAVRDALQQRTDELDAANARLAIKVTEAEAASRAKSEFVANMSHELRTPLNGVLGISQLLRRQGVSPTQQGYLDLLEQSGEQLLSLIDDVLDVSRIEAGRLETVDEPFDLPDVLEAAVLPQAPTATGKGLELILDLDPELPLRVRGDAVRLRQVLINLVGNALKFTTEGSVTVQADWQGTHCRIEVSDTGPGIPLSNQATLFDAFSQGDTSRTRGHGGAGLGLAISRGLVAAMGGTLSLDSEVGAGTAFVLTLPVGLVTPAVAQSPRGRTVVVCIELARQRTAVSQALRAVGAHPVPTDLAGRDATLSRNLGAWLVTDTYCDGADAHLCKGLTRALLLSGSGELPPGAGQWSIAPRPCSREALSRWLHGPDVQPESGAGHTSGGRVLVADDHPVNRLVVQGMLSSAGFEVIEACDGQEAIDAAEDPTLAAVLMDCQMPTVDGYEATRRIRARELAEGRQRVPIVALTAHATADDAKQAMAAGMDGYVTKPARLEEILAVLDRVRAEPETTSRPLK